MDIVEAIEKRAELVEKLQKEAVFRIKNRTSAQLMDSYSLRQNLIEKSLQNILQSYIDKGDLEKALEVIDKMGGFSKNPLIDSVIPSVMQSQSEIYSMLPNLSDLNFKNLL
jgi:hypothetical protein